MDCECAIFVSTIARKVIKFYGIVYFASESGIRSLLLGMFVVIVVSLRLFERKHDQWKWKESHSNENLFGMR